MRGSSAQRWLWFWSSGQCTGTDIRTTPSAQNRCLTGGNDGVLAILTLSGGTYDAEDSSHSLMGSPVKTTLMVLVYTSLGMFLSVHTGEAAQPPSPGWKCTKTPSHLLTINDVFGASDVDRLHLLFPQLQTQKNNS